jgi:hypothetical protein
MSEYTIPDKLVLIYSLYYDNLLSIQPITSGKYQYKGKPIVRNYYLNDNIVSIFIKCKVSFPMSRSINKYRTVMNILGLENNEVKAV